MKIKRILGELLYNFKQKLKNHWCIQLYFKRLVNKRKEKKKY